MWAKWLRDTEIGISGRGCSQTEHASSGPESSKLDSELTNSTAELTSSNRKSANSSSRLSTSSSRHARSGSAQAFRTFRHACPVPARVFSPLELANYRLELVSCENQEACRRFEEAWPRPPPAIRQSVFVTGTNDVTNFNT